MSKIQGHCRDGSRVTRCAFVALCILAGVLSMSDASWALRLKAEGYYADLEASLIAGGNGVAGTSESLFARVRNHGGDDAESVTIALRLDESLLMNDPACAMTGSGAYVCELEQPLPVDSEYLHEFVVSIDPWFAGASAAGVLASSELSDPVPDNSFAVASLWIERNFDARVDLVPRGVWQGPLGKMVTFRVSNEGPSAAVAQELRLTVEGESLPPAASDCGMIVYGACSSDQTFVSIGVGESVDVDVAIPEPLPEGPGYVLRLRATASASEDWNGTNDVASFRYSLPLFESGFE